MQYRYKDEDIDHIVREKKKFSKTDTNKIAQQKIELLKQKVCCYFYLFLVYLQLLIVKKIRNLPSKRMI
jgi:hypothetical protein